MSAPGRAPSILTALAVELTGELEALLQETRSLRDDGDELHLRSCTLGAEHAALDLWAEQLRLVSLAELLTRLVSVAPGCPCVPAVDPWGGAIQRLTPLLLDHDHLLDDAATCDNVLRADTPLEVHLSALGVARLHVTRHQHGASLWAAAAARVEHARAAALALGGRALHHVLSSPPTRSVSAALAAALHTHPGPAPTPAPPVVVGLTSPRLAGFLALTAGEILGHPLPAHPTRVLVALPEPLARGLAAWEPGRVERCTDELGMQLRANPALVECTLACWAPPTTLAEAAALARNALSQH